MSTNQRILRIYWQHARKYKAKLWQIYTLMVIAQISEDVVAPLLISGILTALANNDLEALSLDRIWGIFAIILFLEIFAMLIWNVVVRIFWRTQDLIKRDLTMTAFDHMQKMSYKFFADRFAGSLVNQTNKFVSAFERLTDPLTWNVFKLIVSMIFTMIILFPVAPIVALSILVLAAVYTPYVWYVRRKQVPLTSKWAAAETVRTGQLADAITNIVAVKSFSNEKLEHERMYDRATDVHHRSIDTMKLNMKQELGTGSLSRSIQLAVIIFSVLLAVNGTIEVGIIYLSLTFTTAILRRLWDLNHTFRQFTRVFGDASDMAEILAIEPDVADSDDAEPFNASSSDVEFRDVTFGYADSKGEKLFENLNLKIKSGEKIGLVGPSGGGKTSVTKLLLRFMDVEGGEILVGGQNIAKVKQSEFRDHISYVPQEPLLFHRSIRENIGYGNATADEKAILLASKQSNAHEFVEKLSEGYETLVGERGVKLSGGQKQRVAIARAMVKDAPILVLDEATSALDSESEKLIQDALWKLMEGRTAIVIAHRLSTIQKMDRIIVMEDGAILEEGSHQELLKHKGKYAELWAHQSGGFLEE